LILNARDAIADRPGSIEMRITTIGERWLEITTQDSGPGFSDKALTQALDPFFTTKGGEGTGLGLSMVYDLTKLTGGRTKLSNTDQGARVSLRLPLRIAPPLDPEKLVLLVEDDDDLRTTIREQLITLGHREIEASTVDEAQALATLPEIGLILSDIHLGGPQTGLDLLDTLHSTGLSAQTRLMTSLPPPDPLRQQAAARYPLISKPFEAADLRAFLSQSCTP
jgi:CheY-like chemotaxis protein